MNARIRIVFVLIALCVGLGSGMRGASAAPGAGAQGLTPSTVSPATTAAPVARYPGRNLAALLSPADFTTAQRLEDTLEDLLAESLARNGAPFDVSTYSIGGITPYHDVFLVNGTDPIVDITIGGGSGGYSAKTLNSAAAAMKSIPGVRVLGVASATGHGIISATVPPAQLLAVAGVSGVRQVNASGAMTSASNTGGADGKEDIGQTSSPQTAVLSQGVIGDQAEQVLDIDAARRVFDLDGNPPDGSGVDIGTLSDSANERNAIPGDGLVGIDESQNLGDLPPDGRIVLLDRYLGRNPTDEGRAMMEHIYDIAPAVAQMGFSSALNGEARFANNITALAGNGMNIINDDVFYYDEPYFQDGVIAQAVDNYVDGGGIYFAAAGNLGHLAFEDQWHNSNGNQYFDFVTGGSTPREVLQITISNNATLRLGLQWTQPWGNATTDLNIELWDSTLTTKLAGSTTNNVGGNPYDGISYQNTTGGPITANIAVSYSPHGGDTAPTGLTLKFVAFQNGASGVTFNEYPERWAGTITPHAGTAKSIAVGAAPWYFPTMAENYSSYGPHRQFFNPAGSPVGPYTFSKPDFMAVDGCNTSFFGGDIPQDTDTWPNFFGTSAATPNAAGVAALMVDVAGGPGSLNQEDIRRLLRETAIDLGSPGYDHVYGYGRIDALGAVAAARGPLYPEFSLYPNQFGDVSMDQNLYNDTDIDRYQYATDVSGTVEIDVTKIDPYMDPMLETFRQFDGAFLKADYNGGVGDNARLTHTALSGVMYTAETMSETSFSGSADYTISINGPSPGVTPLVLNSFGDATLSGNLYANADLDYYRVYAPDDINGGLTVTCTPSGFNSVIVLFNDAGTRLAQSNSGGWGAADTIYYTGSISPEEQFVVLVTSASYSGSGDYSLHIDFDNAPGQPLVLSPLPSTVSFTIRPNPVTGSFSYLYPTLSQGAAIHSLWVPDSGSQTITATTGSFFDSVTGGLYNLQGSRLAVGGPSYSIAVDASERADNSYIYRQYGAGDVGVFAFGPEILSINSSAQFSESPAPADLISPVPLTDSGSGYVYYQTVNDGIQEPGDQNFFEVQAPDNAVESMTLTMTQTSALDGLLQLYDATGALLESSNVGGSGGTETVVHPVTPGATYYIRVTNADSSVTLADPTQHGDYTLLIQIPIFQPTITPTASPSLTPSPTPTPSLTPTASATPSPSPTASPTLPPPCSDVRVAFSFEEPASGAPATLNGGTDGDIMVSPGPGEILAHVLVPHEQLIHAFDPRDPKDPKVSLTDVGLDGFDLISFPRSANDSTLLRVFWSSEIDFVTGPNSVLGAGIAIHNGDLLTNTGAVWPNAALLGPFAPKDGNGTPIEGDFGLDALDVKVTPDEFDQFDPGIYHVVKFPLAFSFEEANASGVVDSFVIGAGPDSGKSATHGDILELPDITLLRTNGDLTKGMISQTKQQGLDALDDPTNEVNESGRVPDISSGWLFSVEEFETLSAATDGDVIEEANGVYLTNAQITGDANAEYGLDGLDIVCGPEIATPTPTATPFLTPTPSPTPSPSPTPVCLDPRIVFSFEEPTVVTPTTLNGGTDGDVMISAPLGSNKPPTVLVPHSELIQAFDPRDPNNTATSLTDVGLDALDLISFPRSVSDSTPLRIFWSSEIDFVTGNNSVLGAGIVIHHGDLLTNTGAVWQNSALVGPFAPETSQGSPLSGDFGLDAVDVAMTPQEFDSFAPGVYTKIPFEVYFSFEEINGGGVSDSFTIGAGPDAGMVATHGDILALPEINIEKSHTELTGGLPGGSNQQGLDAIDNPSFDEQIETGPVTLGSGGWLFSVEESETLTNATHGDLLEEAIGVLYTNGDLTGDPSNQYGLDALDVVCLKPAPTPTPTATPLVTATPTATAQPTGTPEPSPSPTATPSPSPTGPTPSPTATRVPTPGDTDGDGFRDSYELAYGSDPYNPNSVPMNLDLNGDGHVTVEDAALLFNFLTGADSGDPYADYDSMDFNGDGKITLVDALLFYRNRNGTGPVIPLAR